MSASYTHKVRRYYDANTSIFRLFEPKGETIHRAVWAPGVSNRRAAIDYTNELVAAEVTSLAERDALPREPLRLVDLGCGTGGTFLFLADRLRVPWGGLAVTLSPIQVKRAREGFARRGIDGRCRVTEGDYLRLPEDGPFDVAIAIESFVHCPEPLHFFAEVARVLRPGGRLLLCDDLISERASKGGWVAGRTCAPRTEDLLDQAETTCLAEFSRGWLAPAPQSVRSLVALASAASLRLVSQTNLTPSLRILAGASHPAGRALAGQLLRIGAIDHPLVRGLSGGLALQLALARGLIEYQWLCFERP